MWHALFVTTLMSLPPAPASARGGGALVVLSEPLEPPYREAFEGLLSQWTESLETSPAGRPLPPGPHAVIIALGGRAARTARRADAPLVVALAPSYPGRGRRSATVVVEMTPSPERIVSLLAAAGVRHLVVVRAAPAEAGFARRASAAGTAAGVWVEDALLRPPESLSALLRRSGRRADAVWLAPDPAAVMPETFAAARGFSRARSIPFFAPTTGLVAGEVRGELAVSFADCGREAARAARDILAGRPVPARVYPGEPSEGDRQPAP